MNHLEIEYKTLLSKEKYHELLQLFEKAPQVQQTNYYIDSPDFQIKSKKASLRIRTLPDRAELTLKVAQAVGNMEYNQELTLQEAQEIRHSFELPDGQITDLLSQLGIHSENLRIWGELTTTRREQQLPMGLAALDYNQFLGREDYELEVEVDDAETGKAAFDDFLASHDISFQYASSKVARVAKAQQEM